MIFSSSPRLKSWVAFFVIAFSIWVQAQTKTNLDVFKVLVDSSISEALADISDSQKEIYADLKLTSQYSVFENQIFKSIQAQKKNAIKTSDSPENIRLSYSIENAAVNYGEVFRDGFLGDHFVDRKIYISGSYLFNSEEMRVKDFYYESIDTIEFDKIQSDPGVFEMTIETGERHQYSEEYITLTRDFYLNF